ncbi:b5c5f9d8-3cb3-4e42-b6a4-e19d470d8950 [Sclerotinia trifoliorum]|uniref:B5c5f9d8-3cb3-4e42-b6a4-e19d470d8950 n=1 Tax=Sclerotinia trifoliorum TaxID=28548 RepID=A0A8H2ZX85_9HELO|nr:b5c5f9d8-3cb3-4e42-b6a4-e19d470d8950 [Sclerotinia trifoliorum]
MVVAPANLSSSRLQQRQRKAAPPVLSFGAPQIRAPRRRATHHPKVESVSSTNMSRDDPPSPPPNPPPSPSMLIELDDDDFKI